MSLRKKLFINRLETGFDVFNTTDDSKLNKMSAMSIDFEFVLTRTSFKQLLALYLIIPIRSMFRRKSKN